MATVTINNSPVHSDTVLTAVYGERGSHWVQFHTGTDFAPTGATPANPPLFSVCAGIVAQIRYTSALGNQILIKDDVTGNYWRYCHMRYATTLSVGDRVNITTQVGVMGMSGNATGVHLHLELSTTIAWDYNTFLNPSIALGIPNERGTVVKYDGTAPPPEPPTPTGKKKKRKFPFVLYARKLRKR